MENLGTKIACVGFNPATYGHVVYVSYWSCAAIEHSETPVAMPESSSFDNQSHASEYHSHKSFSPEVVVVLQPLAGARGIPTTWNRQ